MLPPSVSGPDNLVAIPEDEPQVPAEGPSSHCALVARIQCEDEAAAAELYEQVNRGLRYFFIRQLGPEVAQDLTHDTMVVVLRAIRQGRLREPSKLGAFIHSIAKHLVRAQIKKRVAARNREVELETPGVDPRSSDCPEREIQANQRIALIGSVLSALAPRDQEVLTRFYVREQSPDQICAEMGLTDTQYRLLKSRAKAKFGDIGKRTLNRKPLRSFAIAG